MSDPTPSQTIGPFFSFGLAPMVVTDLVASGCAGALGLAGRILDGDGAAVEDAMVEVWQADPGGKFPPASPPGWSGFGRCLTDAEGRYSFAIAKPGRVDASSAPHVDVSVFARGLLQRLVTRIYFPDEVAANAADPVLAAVDPDRRSTLVATSSGPGNLLFDIRLQGSGETVFFAW